MAAVHHFARVITNLDMAVFFKRGLNIVCSGHAKGQPNKGVAYAPSVIVDKFNLPDIVHKSNHYDDIHVTDSHRDCIDDYDTITIGGDHMIAYDSIAYQLTKIPNKKFGLVWVDAHSDINTYESSVTKNKHGMVVSNLMGIDNSINGPYDISNNYLMSENIAYVGLRSVDPPEKEFIKEYNINSITSDDINMGGGTFFINHVLQWKLRHCDHIHVSFDVDVMDPKIFPATGTPVPNGIDYRRVSEMTAQFYNDLRIKSMDLVEYDPSKDDKDFACGKIATDIITSSFTNSFII